MSRLAIITTHPIQYYAPVFKALAKADVDTKVFYTWGRDSVSKFDPDFQRHVEWDIPLLEGYDYQFLENTSSKPGTDHFKGIVNPDAISSIDAFDPDVLLVYGWAWHSHLKIIRYYSKKKKVWFRGDSTLLDEARFVKKVARFLLLRWVYSHVDLAFFVGTRNKQYFHYFGLKERQLKFAPHAIDNSRFGANRRTDAQQIRDQFNIPDTGILLLFAGKLEHKKDPVTLLEAFEALEAENAYLLFAGNGMLKETLLARASNSRKKDRLFFLDFQNQTAMPALYQACQIFCLPSAGPGETWGLAVNEAMAAGCTILASDKVGCSVDLVKEGVNGCIFKSKDHEDLAQKLRFLTSHSDRLAEFGKASKEIIENWSIQRQVSFLLNELNKIPCRQ